jgi:arabinogalactan oligomer/maltooligosaccharide transport system substrate-binding protein
MTENTIRWTASQAKRFLVAGLLLEACVIMLPLQALAKTDLVIWHAYRGQEKAAFEKVINLYNRKMSAKQVSVRTLAVPYDAYADKITAAVPRGKGPDLFIFAQDRLGGWVEAGRTVEPIDFFIEDETRRQFVPNMMEAMTYRGTVYGLPLNFKSITMIYNKAMLKTPPKTSGELVQLAKRLTDPASGKFGLAYAYNDFYYHAALMNAFGGRVFDPAGPTPVIDSPQNLAAVNLMMKWFKQDGILPAEPSTALITSLFNDNKAAIVFSGPWFLGEIATNIDYGLAILPSIDEAEGGAMRPWLTIEGVYVSAGSAHKEQAYELAKFLASEEAGLILAKEGRQLHTNKAIYTHAEVANDVVLSAFRKQLETAIPMPNYAEMTLMWSPMTTAMNKIIKGSASPEAALGLAQQAVEKDIAALRKGR